MITSYKLNFSIQTFPFNKNAKLYQFDKSKPHLLGIYDGRLQLYYILKGIWQTVPIATEFITNPQKLYISKISDKNILIVKDEEGIKFFQYIEHQLKFLYKDDQFHDVYDWWKPSNFIKFGNFFQNNVTIGLITKHEEYGINVHVIMKNDILDCKPAIRQLNTNLEMLNHLVQNKTNFYISPLEEGSVDNIIVQTSEGLHIFKFDEKNALHQKYVVPCCRKNDSSDKLFFGHITGNKFQDIIYLNSSGLFLYQQDSFLDNYKFLNYDPLFSKQKGWTQKYTDNVVFEDINFDGKEEMLFSGPQGLSLLSYNKLDVAWKSLLKNSDLSIQERFGFLVYVIRDINKPTMLIYYQNKLHFAIINEIIKQQPSYYLEDNKISGGTSKQKISDINSLRTSFEPEQRKILFLRDQIDYDTILDSIDTSTGKLKFLLPLIQLPNLSIQLNIIYDGMTSGELGYGWSIPKNLIIFDHQSSIFFDDEKYYIIFQNVMQELSFDAINSTESIYFFKLAKTEAEEYSDLEIRYYRYQECWELKRTNLTQIFGTSFQNVGDSVHWEQTWKYWRGDGEDVEGQQQLAVAWYLTDVTDYYNNTLRYSYISEFITSSAGVNTTKAVHLQQISDNEGNQIKLNYVRKSHTPSRDYLSNISKSKNSLYLTSYELITINYEQHVNFVYASSNGTELLSAIIQKNDKPALQFFYNTENEIEKIIFSLGSSIKFDYEPLKSLSLSDKSVQKININKNYRVLNTNGYLLISSINDKGKVELHLYNEDMTHELYSTSTWLVDSKLPLLGKKEVIAYEVTTGKDFFCIILGYEKVIEIYIFNWIDDKQLSLNPTVFRFSEKCLIKFGLDFFVVADLNSYLAIIEFDKGSNLWKEKLLLEKGNQKKVISTAANNNFFVIYNDTELKLWHKDKSGKWNSKILKGIPSLLTNIRESFDQFDLQTDIQDHLFTYFKNNLLQVSKNLIFLNSLTLKEGILYSQIHLFVLNKNYEIAQEQREMVYQENIYLFTKQLQDDQDNTFLCNYTLDSGKIKFNVISFKGPLFDSIETAMQIDLKKYRAVHSATLVERERKLNQDVKVLHNKIRQQIVDRWGKKIFMLDYNKYKFYLNSPNAISANYIFKFTGNKWVKENWDKEELLSIPIGGEFILKKENDNSTVKLYKQNPEGKNEGSVIIDLLVKHFNQTQIRYPVYLAYQDQKLPVQIIEFLNGRISKKYELPAQEKLSPWSTNDGIFTEICTALSDFCYLMYRSLVGINRLLPYQIISRSTIHFDDNMQRVTGYEYDVTSARVLGNTILFENTTVIPGNNKRVFGWIQDIKLQNYSIKRMYNTHGDITKELKQNSTKPDNGQNNIRNFTIFDKTNKFSIAEFFPYDIRSEACSFYGFEDYEIHGFGKGTTPNENCWNFKEDNIVKKNFSFTGENYLSLNSNEILEGTFFPKNENITFVASAWIRSPNEMPKLDSVTPILKVVFLEDNKSIGFISEVKMTSNGWYYLECIINIQYAKHLINVNNAQNRKSKLETKEKLKTIVTLGPESNNTIYVDHIRFSPLDAHFKAKVYNVVTKNLREEILENGLVKRYIYDKYGENIATINEYGELTEFTTYSKVSSSIRLDKPKSNVQILTNGFYEQFSPLYLFENWQLSNASNFQISPGNIHHDSPVSHFITLKSTNVDKLSFGLRMYYSLCSQKSYLQINQILQISHVGESAHFIIKESNKKLNLIPLSGEILLLAEGNRLFVWIDGGLLFDSVVSKFKLENDSHVVKIEINGTVSLGDVMVFNNFEVVVTYFNGLGEKIQEIILEGENSAVVTAFLYDELGRQSITTKPLRIKQSTLEPILAYYVSLVINCNPLSERSVWKTGKLTGTKFGNSSLGEYDFREIQFINNPLSEVRVLALPGKEFSASGPYSKHFDSSTDILFIKNHFPRYEGYSYRTEYKLGAVSRVVVLDANDNRVAIYTHTPNNKDLLSTYEFDDNKRLVKILPPLYHEKVETFYKLLSQVHTLNEEEILFQQILGTHMTYDSNGKIKTKKTPDSGKVEQIYDENGMVKFIVYYTYNSDELVNCVLYFIYDKFNRLINTGQILPPPSSASQLNDTVYNNARKYQEIYYNDADRDPVLRRRIKRTITFNSEQPLFEESLFNLQQETLSKRIIVPTEDNQSLIVQLNKKFAAGKLVKIEYPFEFFGEPFVLNYEYNKSGKIKALNIANYTLFTFTYNPSGQVTNEVHFPQSRYSFTRSFFYNTPGYISKLSDPFLEERVFYTEYGYGGFGYGDGTITQTVFKAKWHNYSRINECDLLNEYSFISETINSETSKMCFNKLKNTGYLDEFNHQTKIFYPDLEVNFPITCSQGISRRFVANILGRKGFPVNYGYSYDYGNHQELTKAKYFVEGNTPSPFQVDTFTNEIPAIRGNNSASINIWDILTSSGYIIQDRDKLDLKKAHGKRGKSFINSSLIKDLSSINIQFKAYFLKLGKLLCFYFAKRKSLSLLEFWNIFSEWNTTKDIEKKKKTVTEIYFMLQRKQYLQNPLADNFIKVLKDFAFILPDIVGSLLKHFATELGEAEFDVESFDIDANGNHKKYYTGFDRFEINYQNSTNRIAFVKFKTSVSSEREKTFSLDHDSRGNVIKAPHKGITKIHYHPVLNRTTKIELADGRIITFSYDAQGERIVKKVTNGKGETTKVVNYVRDEFGRVLLEREITYITSGQPPDLVVTLYIYGPIGLLGFVRRNEYYSVIRDHENSTRLVVKNGEVVAAYDYLPYGNLMREYASYPEAHITYRYTGQEWDEETGLYNFHARFYDPCIGRFYQTDPKEQYFSPYKYAGNSPISNVDPDGEWAHLVIFMFLGMFFGGAAANNTLDFTKWNWKSLETWNGIIVGGISGALMPGAFSQSVAALKAIGFTNLRAIATISALGSATSYISMAGINNEWNPLKFKLDSQTLFAAFVGFGIGSGAVGEFFAARNIILSLNVRGKMIFLSGILATGSTTLYIQGEASNWDFTKPEMWFGLINVVTSAADFPIFTRTVSKFFIKNGRVIKSSWKNIKRVISKGNRQYRTVKPVVNAVTKLVAGVGLASFYSYFNTAAAYDNWDITYWNWCAIGNYHTIITSLVTSGQLASTASKNYKVYKAKVKAKLIQSAIEKSRNEVNRITEEYKIVSEVLDIKLGYRTSKESSAIPKQYDIYLENLDATKFSTELSRSVKNGDIPKSGVLAIGTTENFLIAEFSAENAPGLIVCFTHKKISSPVFLHKEINGRTIVSKGNNPLKIITEIQSNIKQNTIEVGDFLNLLSTRLETIDKSVVSNVKKKTFRRKDIMNEVNSFSGERKDLTFSVINIDSWNGKDKTNNLKHITKITEQDNLKPAECPYKVSTSQIKNIPSDPEWGIILADELLNIKQKKLKSKRRESLLPFTDVMNKDEISDEVDILDDNEENLAETRSSRSLNDGYTTFNTKNSASKNHSPLNYLFEWIKKSYTYWTSDLKSISNDRMYQNKFNKPQNVLTQTFNNLDINDLLLLANVAVAKLFNISLFTSTASTDNYIDEQANALNITSIFECAIENIAKKCGINIEELVVDFTAVHHEILGKIIGEQYNEILTVLNSCISFNFGRLGTHFQEKQFEYLMTKFNNKLVTKFLNTRFKQKRSPN